MDAASPVAGSSLAADGISDQRFATQLETIKKLKQFLFDEKILLQADSLENIDLGSLNNLKYAPNGRSPTEDEWKALDQKLAGLTPLLTPALRWKLRIRELRFFFMTVPMFFMGITATATLSLALLKTFGEGSSVFFVFPFLIIFIRLVEANSAGKKIMAAHRGQDCRLKRPDADAAPRAGRAPSAPRAPRPCGRC
jgi:hypothetical protein